MAGRTGAVGLGVETIAADHAGVDVVLVALDAIGDLGAGCTVSTSCGDWD